VNSEAVASAHRRLRSEVAARQSTAIGTSPQVVVGLIGRSIQASKTPFMHEREGARVGIPYTYVLIDFDALGLEDGDLGAMLAQAERLGFAGVNVTHPFKQSVISHLGALSPEAAAMRASMQRTIAEILEDLTPKEQRVLRMRFGLDTVSDHTLEEVGKQLEVTRERVRQIEMKAMAKLRQPSRADKLRVFLEGA
jgi:RNA polymerase sigma factor (sigma-70 family)